MVDRQKVSSSFAFGTLPILFPNVDLVINYNMI